MGVFPRSTRSDTLHSVRVLLRFWKPAFSCFLVQDDHRLSRRLLYMLILKVCNQVAAVCGLGKIILYQMEEKMGLIQGTRQSTSH